MYFHLSQVIAPWYNVYMNCLICRKSTNNKKYCCRTCSEKAKFGRKRPDLTLRNKTNNPMWKQKSRIKMIKSLTGKKQDKQHVEKRKLSIIKKHKLDPTLRIRQTEKVRELAHNKPMGWSRIRLIALKRDGYKCQECGKENKRLIVHHKDHKGRNLPSILLMNNNLDNLITLCSGCHIRIHTWKVRKSKQVLAP